MGAGPEGETQCQTGSAAGAKAGELAGAQHAVSTLMIKEAKQINFQFSLQAYIGRKKNGGEGRKAGGSLSSHRNDASEQG